MSFISPFTGNVIQPTDVSYRSVALSANTQLFWPINGGVTDNVAARIMDVTASTAGLSLSMPPANQASVGQDALIRNIGANTFTVKDAAGNSIASVAPSASRYIYITTNATIAGTWGNIAFGVGSSNVDAGALAGYGLKAITNTLNAAHNITTFSSAYTATASDRASYYVWNDGAGTLTLTSAVTLGNDWFMMLRNGGTGTLTVSPSSGDLINGAASISLQPSDSCFICCSGLAFYTVGLGRSTQFNFTQLTKSVTSGSYSLTSAEAANVVQKYTGTLSGNVTITLPQTVQVYYITNQTNGTGAGYQITFTTGAGGGTATVPAGEQVILLCDSVNLLNASTIAAGALNVSLVNGTVGAPSLNFASENSTGIYRPAVGELGMAILGTKLFGLSSAGLTISGTGTFTGGISGGVF
ncbi:MAG: hypothetical protein EBU08_05945 [Micrococcales bacterium]|nr:hypothetical protein [Micrococcales bacterium]